MRSYTPDPLPAEAKRRVEAVYREILRSRHPGLTFEFRWRAPKAIPASDLKVVTFWGGSHEQRLLQEHGLETLGDIASRTRAQVGAIKGIGPRTLDAIDALLERWELAWSPVSE